MFSVYQSGDQVAYIEYFDDSFPVSTPFYTEDEEDANFGLWVYNIITNKERCALFCKNNG
ncbi:hypothetical protein SAMN05421788_106253 [Filimonas lacunae]|uniref:Uncharacterized protein n=1 Tax=Filimonas lacunae TaxID=477680 RepID=A0A1N7QQY0_9BACT|nr:hypothetical protein SAMN05421788_106253 [Filimonas lacunae]